MNNAIAAKNVDGEQVVRAVAMIEKQKGGWVGRWYLGWCFPEVPERVLLAKLRRLVRAEKLDGCACGCRGDFTVEPKI